MIMPAAKIPLATAERILKEAGARRVSKEAASEFALVLEKIAGEIAADAAKFAEHAGRRTIVEADIKLAKK
jgi:histone H3/H4